MRKRQVVWLAAALLPMAALAFAALQFEYFSWDLSVTRWLQSFRQPALREWLRFVSWIGQGTARNVTMYAIAVAAFLAFKQRREAVFCAVAPGVAHAISGLVKAMVARPRPSADLVEVLLHHSSKSYPSGHVLSFVGFYGLLIYFSFRLVKTPSWRMLFVCTFAAMVLSVGPSRVYMGAHWPSDVLGGYIMGSAWLFMAIALYNKGKRSAK